MSRSASILDHYPAYEVVIGIEVHVQLHTNTKIFCTCANEVVKEPNKNICQICTGYPGVLPVLNKKVVDYAILAGLATNCEIASVSEFARKHYFYPDLPKNFQITQDDRPICSKGFVPIRLQDGTKKDIRLTRIHIEEDAGKNIHGTHGNSFVNLNRAGTPLLEIVTEPDIASTEEARAYLKTLHAIVRYLGISSANMEEGAFRGDTNISVRPKGQKELGTKVELKNINSFKFIADAIEHEIQRQIELIESGGRVTQETRLWDTSAKKTVVMRSKEEAADYRYLPEPDLPLVDVSAEWINRIKAQMPELPDQKIDRLMDHYGLSLYEADILVDNPEIAQYYEKATEITKSKTLINYVLRDVMGYLKEHKIGLHEFKITPEKLAELVHLLDTDKINNRAAQEVFAAAAESGEAPADIVKAKGLEQIGSAQELEAIVQKIIADNPDNVAAYKSGKDKLFGFFVGQAMKATKGKGNPKILQELLKKHLS